MRWALPARSPTVSCSWTAGASSSRRHRRISSARQNPSGRKPFSTRSSAKACGTNQKRNSSLRAWDQVGKADLIPCEAIQKLKAKKDWIASSQELLAMTVMELYAHEHIHRTAARHPCRDHRADDARF